MLVVGFTYFYTDVIFRQQNLPETLQSQGGFIPGIRPGTRTAEFLNGVVQRITLVGALFLGIVAILPFLVRPLVGTDADAGHQHRPADRGGRGAGHDEAARGAAADAPL